MIDFVKLELDQSFGNYSYRDASNIEMNILGNFLTDDVACYDCSPPSYREWALDYLSEMPISGNITFLDKDGDYIFLKDQCSEEINPTELKMSRQQFVRLLDDWKEKVCKSKPKEVVIKRENNEFIIETNE